MRQKSPQNTIIVGWQLLYAPDKQRTNLTITKQAASTHPKNVTNAPKFYLHVALMILKQSKAEISPQTLQNSIIVGLYAPDEHGKIIDHGGSEST